MTIPATTNTFPSSGLRIDGVSKQFGSATVIDNLTLDIPDGAFATLLGPSGCGKTTLLRMVAGFYEPDGGQISLGNKRIDHLPAHQRGTAMVFQDYAIFPHMTVGENVGYGLRLANVAKPAQRRRIAEMLDFVGLSGFENRRPDQLSGGQQQRVALARALIVEPKVLLLDEPLSNLDATLRERMRWELRALQQRLKITFLYVTHDQGEAFAMSDWIAVMNNGRIEQWDTPRTIYQRPRTAFAATFVGSANLKPAKVLGHDAHILRVSLNGHELHVSAPEMLVGDTVLLCMRPETLSLGVAPSDASCLTLVGTLIRIAFLGNITRHWLQIGNEEWIVDGSNVGVDDLLSVNENVTVTLYPEYIHVIAS